MRVPTEELNGQCVFNQKIRGRIGDIAVEKDMIVVKSYNRYECPLPNGKPQEGFSVEQFWEWMETQGFTVIPALVYKIV